MRIILALAFIAVVACIAVWDVWCAAKGTPDDTVSATLQSWAQQHSMLAVAVGAVIGHIFWPTRPR